MRTRDETVLSLVCNAPTTRICKCQSDQDERDRQVASTCMAMSTGCTEVMSAARLGVQIDIPVCVTKQLV
jgi:hypothetical protein